MKTLAANDRLPKDSGTLPALVARWREEALVLRRRGALGQAEVLEGAATEMEALLAIAGESTVSLQEAAALSGYTTDALTRLVRRGALQNLGRPRAPRFRVRDLPRKPSALRSTPVSS